MKTIACIVVTFNRLSLLKNCIENLRKQSLQDFDTIVINNGSTDGTEEWLLGQNDIRTITQENLGGAGGFYTGMKVAYEAGYEWLWMMDDDGIAEPNQLQNLIEGVSKCKSQFVNALVCNIDNHSQLAFGLIKDGIKITNVEETSGLSFIEDSINPFNGTLIHRTVIEKIGMIKKEMFIWGDEMEYTLRAKSYGYTMCTIVSAIHFHPMLKGRKESIIPLLPQFKVVIKPKERSHIYFRNLGYIYKHYLAQQKYKIIIEYLLYYLFRLNFVGVYNFIKSFSKGEKNVF